MGGLRHQKINTDRVSDDLSFISFYFPQATTHSLQKRDIREIIKSKRSLLSGEGVRNPCLVKNGKYPPYPPCNVKAVSDCYPSKLVHIILN